MKLNLVLQKGAQSSEWGTPREVLDVARASVGPFGLDLASSRRWKSEVGADIYFDLDHPCPEIVPERLRLRTRPAVWCNPPAGVAAWWVYR
jgi:hypothetical protein